jgi:hypothetical protein
MFIKIKFIIDFNLKLFERLKIGHVSAEHWPWINLPSIVQAYWTQLPKDSLNLKPIFHCLKWYFRKLQYLFLLSFCYISLCIFINKIYCSSLILQLLGISTVGLFWFRQVLDRGPEQKESKFVVLCPLIIIILISYIIIYYIIVK